MFGEIKGGRGGEGGIYSCRHICGVKVGYIYDIYIQYVCFLGGERAL